MMILVGYYLLVLRAAVYHCRRKYKDHLVFIIVYERYLYFRPGLWYIPVE